MGANLAFLSFFTALARSFDVITDPLMGWLRCGARALVRERAARERCASQWVCSHAHARARTSKLRSDKTRGRHGRRRPFMATGCVLYCVMFVLLFTPPRPDNEGSLANAGNNEVAAYWFGFFYVLFYFTDTYCNVPFEALGPELTDSYEERNNVFFLAKSWNFFGMLIAAGLPAGLSSYLRPETLLRQPCYGGYDAVTLEPVGEAPSTADPPWYVDERVNTTFWSLGFLHTLGKKDSALDLTAKEAYELGDACAPLFESDTDVTLRSTLCVGANGRFCYRQVRRGAPAATGDGGALVLAGSRLLAHWTYASSLCAARLMPLAPGTARVDDCARR